MGLPSRLVVATGNPGKRREWQDLLAPLGVTTIDWTGVSPDEDAPTYTENAAIKALAGARGSGHPALGDDVGLEVDVLDGAPGLHTRRYADGLGGWGPARIALADGASGSPATYRCGLAIAWPDGRVVAVEGAVQGHIAAAIGPGVGFEPCFVPVGCAAALSDLDPSARHVHHHRHRALGALRRRISGAGAQ